MFVLTKFHQLNWNYQTKNFIMIYSNTLGKLCVIVYCYIEDIQKKQMHLINFFIYFTKKLNYSFFGEIFLSNVVICY